MKKVRLLCAADLHLGRSLTNLPEGLEKFISSPKRAWKRLVEYVCDHSNRIDALVLAGDIFDNEQDLYEALGCFEEGIKQILENNTPVIAVAGNHDAHVLKKCERRLNSSLFCLLGENECWEKKSFVFHEKKINFVGWSFAKRKCEKNPLDDFKDDEESLTIGILHCDVKSGSESFYAPVNLSNFEKFKPKAWILGHIHAPEVLNETPLVFYCGSLQGLDSSERGMKGARLIELDFAENLETNFIPFSELLWSSLNIDLSKKSLEELDEVIFSSLRREFCQIPNSVKVVVVKLVFQGRTSFYRYLEDFANKIKGRHFTQVGEVNIPCYIENVVIQAKPEINLESLAKGRDLVSLVAQLINSLENTNENKEKILLEAMEFLKTKIEKNGYIEFKENQIRNLEAELIRAAYVALDMILMQEEE